MLQKAVINWRVQILCNQMQEERNQFIGLYASSCVCLFVCHCVSKCFPCVCVCACVNAVSTCVAVLLSAVYKEGSISTDNSILSR